MFIKRFCSTSTFSGKYLKKEKFPGPYFPNDASSADNGFNMVVSGFGFFYLFQYLFPNIFTADIDFPCKETAFSYVAQNKQKRRAMEEALEKRRKEQKK